MNRKRSALKRKPCSALLVKGNHKPEVDADSA